MSHTSSQAKVKPSRERILELRAMRLPWKVVARLVGISPQAARDRARGKRPALTRKDPGEPPWDADTRPGESPRERAFRRFPITAPKPGLEL